MELAIQNHFLYRKLNSVRFRMLWQCRAQRWATTWTNSTFCSRYLVMDILVISTPCTRVISFVKIPSVVKLKAKLKSSRHLLTSTAFLKVGKYGYFSRFTLIFKSNIINLKWVAGTYTVMYATLCPGSLDPYYTY